MKRIAVIILNWNGKELMEKFLPSVIANSPEELADVIVADNGSTDGSLAMLDSKFPSVKQLVLDRNYGFAEGYNRAIAQVDHEFTVLLNSDVEVTLGWLVAPLAIFDSDEQIAAIQPKILSWHNKHLFEYAGASGGYMDYLGYPYCRGRIFDVVERDQGQYNTITDILWASGACLFIRTQVYKENGGLDASFFAHQEEIDLCWRLRSRGYRIQCVPQSTVYHVGGGTLTAESPRKTFLNFRNNLLMLYKNLPPERLTKVMVSRFFLDYVAALKFLLTGNTGNALAIFKARKAFLQLRRSYEPARIENLSKRKTAIIPELLDESLLKVFYLANRKKYSEL